MITAMNHLTLAVRELERSFVFYKNILWLPALVKWDKGAYFLVGDFWLCLNVDKTRQANPCYTHYAFSVNNDDFLLLSEKIIASGVIIFKNNTSPGNSLYFLDPDGHKLEIHSSNWQQRITAKKNDPGTWKNIEWFI